MLSSHFMELYSLIQNIDPIFAEVWVFVGPFLAAFTQFW